MPFPVSLSLSSSLDKFFKAGRFNVSEAQVQYFKLSAVSCIFEKVASNIEFLTWTP